MASERVDAVVLAGGAGTRIAPVLGAVHKALAPVHGRPFLAYLIDWLAAGGYVGRAVIAAGHGGDQIADYVAQTPLPVETLVVREPEPLGTGGALLNALATARGDSVLALNGDSFVDLDIAAFLSTHRGGNASATVAAVRVEDARRYGTLMLEGERVTGFAEKRDAAGPAWINAGVYLFERHALAAFSAAPCSLERDLLPSLVAAGVSCHRASGRFIDIGTPDAYAGAEMLLAPPGG
jgi:NDP-sugar pyrophosphorylase family protein